MRDCRYEQWFKTEGVGYEYVPKVSIGKFNTEKGLTNQARLGPALDPDVVEQYAEAMRQNDDFPAVIVYEERKQLVPISGNHRLAAALQVEREYLDAYIVRTTDRYIIDRLTRTANSIEGMRPSLAEAIEQGKYLVRKYRRSVTEVAGALRLNFNTLNHAVRGDQTADRLTANQVSLRNLRSDHLRKLASIKSDEVLKPVAQLVSQARLPAPQLGELVKEVNQAHSEAAQLAVVEQFKSKPEVQNRIAETRGGRVDVDHPQRNRLFRALATAQDLIEKHPTLELLHITSEEDIKRLEGHVDFLTRRIGVAIRKHRNPEQFTAIAGRTNGPAHAAAPITVQ